MKKWLALILAIALCGNLMACSSAPVAKSPETTESGVLHGSTVEPEESIPETAPEIEYYEECEVLPAVSTVVAGVFAENDSIVIRLSAVEGAAQEQKVAVYTAPSIVADVVCYLEKNATVQVRETQTVSGTEWALTPDGWVILSQVSNGGYQVQWTDGPSAVTGETGGASATGTVIAAELNIRENPSRDAAVVGSYSKNETVVILETQDGWGRTDQGWIRLDYIDMD